MLIAAASDFSSARTTECFVHSTNCNTRVQLLLLGFNCICNSAQNSSVFCRRGRAENTLCQITIGVGCADALIVRCPQFLFIIVMSVGKWFHLTIQTASICSLAPGIQSSQKPGSQPLVDNYWVLGHGGKRRAAKISGSIIRFNLLSLKN